MLLKLKTECGYQFTSKLESMFTDIKTSQDMMGDYKMTKAFSDASADIVVQVPPPSSNLVPKFPWIQRPFSCHFSSSTPGFHPTKQYFTAISSTSAGLLAVR